ncbi:MAG: DUF3465 domain-containing protein [Thermoanaerobaculia bacterium]|nr:DUF3465 domain-containing protein [Thermoanaerobaculia bacterium]
MGESGIVTRRWKRGRGLGWLLVALVAIGLWWSQGYGGEGRSWPQGPTTSASVDNGELLEVVASRRSGVWVSGAGTVDRILADDRSGDRHQRFIVRVDQGHTVLIAHNIDLAERVPVELGDSVEFRGRFEWNERGGVVHWTHDDPRGRRSGGWIRRGGASYR